MLCGLLLNAAVVETNAGQMPVVGMPPTLHPMNSTWQAATSHTLLPFLADQARLGMFSVGDIVLNGGGILLLAICMRRIVLSQTPDKRTARWQIRTVPSSLALPPDQGIVFRADDLVR